MRYVFNIQRKFAKLAAWGYEEENLAAGMESDVLHLGTSNDEIKAPHYPFCRCLLYGSKCNPRVDGGERIPLP